jgi:hypothetical protein
VYTSLSELVAHLIILCPWRPSGGACTRSPSCRFILHRLRQLCRVDLFGLTTSQRRELEAAAAARVDNAILEADQRDRPVVEAHDGAQECLPGLASFLQVSCLYAYQTLRRRTCSSSAPFNPVEKSNSASVKVRATTPSVDVGVVARSAHRKEMRRWGVRLGLRGGVVLSVRVRV